MRYNNITLHFKDAQGFDSFTERWYETMKEATKDMKAFAKDKDFFNTRAENVEAYKDCVMIELWADGELLKDTPTAWFYEVLEGLGDLGGAS